MSIKSLRKTNNIHIASTPSDKEACARFEYTVYVEEMGYNPPGTDHDKKIVRDQHDRLPNAIQLYAGSIDDIKGVMRLLVWPPNQIDGDFYKSYSMHSFRGIENLTTAEIGRLMIRPTKRSQLLLPYFALKAYELLVLEYNVDLVFVESRPALVSLYRRLGMRPYCADLVRTPEGLMVPTVNVVSDIDYQKAVNSVTADMAQETFGPGGSKAPLDIEPFAKLFDEDNQRIEMDAEKIWTDLQHKIGSPPSEISVFDGLSEADQQTIIQGAAVLDVKAGDEAAVEGRSEQEIYVVLEGGFDVVTNNQVIARLKPGEVFGEMAFFRESATRSATVRAAQNGRMLLLGRAFFNKLKNKHPEAAISLLFNLGRILCERLEEQLPSRVQN